MILSLNIDGIPVDITKIDIQQNYSSIKYSNSSTQIAGNQSIKMLGLVANRDYMKLDNWFNGVLGRNYMSSISNYKKNVIFNSIQIMGIVPIDYTFTQNGIEVTFSVDYLNGDLELFKLKKLRREKLKKLNSLSNV